LDLHALHALTEGVTVDRVSVAEEIGRGGVVGEGVHDLLSGPRRGEMLGDLEVQDPTPMVSEDDQDEYAQASGGRGEEVDRDEIETNVEQEPASVIQDALPRDRTAAALHGFVKPEHPERSDTIGRKKKASADMFLIARVLDDLGGEPPLP
jgi:hypothetical protein